jgi:hypothetical protein
MSTMQPCEHWAAMWAQNDHVRTAAMWALISYVSTTQPYENWAAMWALNSYVSTTQPCVWTEQPCEHWAAMWAQHSHVRTEQPRELSSYVSTEQLCKPEVGTRNFFSSPQSQFHNLKEALPQTQFRNFLKTCCSATATPQFRNRNFFWSPQLGSYNSAFFGIVLDVEFGQFIEKKIGGKKSRATVPLRQVLGFQRNAGF